MGVRENHIFLYTQSLTSYLCLSVKLVNSLLAIDQMATIMMNLASIKYNVLEFKAAATQPPHKTKAQFFNILSHSPRNKIEKPKTRRVLLFL